MGQKPSVRVSQLVFAFYMSGLMSLIMSGVITVINTGLAGSLIQRWLASWVVAWVVAFPLVVFIAPVARRMTEATVRWIERSGPGGYGVRLLLLATLWLVLTNGNPGAWGFGLAVVVLVWLMSRRLFPPGEYRLQPLQLPSFLGWFLARSLLAGWDVSRRLLAPSLMVAPGERTVPLTLAQGGPQWLLANLLSLMPGTLSVEVRGQALLLHCLDTRQDVHTDVAAAERRVARLFGLESTLKESP